MNDRKSIYSIGHSTHPIEEFLSLLKRHEIAAVADVRSYPGSKRYPHFGRDALERSLTDAGIDYLSMKALGGRRSRISEDSRHSAWTVSAFRAYADYADSPEFAAALPDLENRASRAPLAYMCSEGLWWRCHRRIISDHLQIRGWEVLHIMPDGKLVEHK